jgi:hypothetical protein
LTGTIESSVGTKANILVDVVDVDWSHLGEGIVLIVITGNWIETKSDVWEGRLLLRNDGADVRKVASGVQTIEGCLADDCMGIPKNAQKMRNKRTGEPQMGELREGEDSLPIVSSTIVFQMRYSPTISNHETLQVDLLWIFSVSFRDSKSKFRHIVTTIGLTSDPEVIGSQFGEILEKLKKKSVGIVGGLKVTGGVICGVVWVGETNTWGWFQENDVGDLVPGIGIDGKWKIFVGDEGTEFGEETTERRWRKLGKEP